MHQALVVALRTLALTCRNFEWGGQALAWASSCGTWFQLPSGFWKLSSPTRDWTRVPCVRKKTPNHWTTRAVPWQLLISLKLFLNEKFKDSPSDVVWDLHVFERELQSPDFPSPLKSQSVWVTTACAGEGSEACSQVLWVPLICRFPLMARGGGHIHSYCLICFSSSDSLAWKNSIGKEQFGILRLLFSYLIYAEHFSRNCLPPLVNTLSSLLLCIKASC